MAAAVAALAGCLHRPVEAKQLPPSCWPCSCTRTAASNRSGGSFGGSYYCWRPHPSTMATSRSRGLVVFAVMSKPKKKKDETMAPPAPVPEDSATKTVYRDNWFDRLAIRHMSHSLQATTGLKNEKPGYEGFVEATRVVFRTFGPAEQRQMVIGSLNKAIPGIVLALIRRFLTNNKFTREYFAFFTTIFFSWLIGPSEVRESEFQGKLEKNVVYIKKCRFLEGTNCVGMCTNLCKIPSQEFIKDKLGMPLTMVPNFEDMSCEMIFGQEPPADADDPALKQPCYQICQMKRRHSDNCASK